MGLKSLSQECRASRSHFESYCVAFAKSVTIKINSQRLQLLALHSHQLNFQLPTISTLSHPPTFTIAMAPKKVKKRSTRNTSFTHHHDLPYLVNSTSVPACASSPPTSTLTITTPLHLKLRLMRKSQCSYFTHRSRTKKQHPGRCRPHSMTKTSESDDDSDGDDGKGMGE